MQLSAVVHLAQGLVTFCRFLLASTAMPACTLRVKPPTRNAMVEVVGGDALSAAVAMAANCILSGRHGAPPIHACASLRVHRHRSCMSGSDFLAGS